MLNFCTLFRRHAEPRSEVGILQKLQVNKAGLPEVYAAAKMRYGRGKAGEV